jgi:DNA (cytosine-5)-methyltransferase 1
MKNIFNLSLTYISLFSSAGVGCYGFKEQGFECVATVEIIRRRLDIQKFNSKCKYNSGYIADDIVKKETKEKIFKEIMLWRESHKISDIDVVIATPPCQGMSVANHKKKNEIIRNSLVVESIKLVNEIKPKIFIIENVKAFLKSICTDIDGKEKSIKLAIEMNMGGLYNIHYQVINFKDYGNPSSRTRTLVIGVRKDLIEVTPLDLMPKITEERTVRDIIGHLKRLKKMGEIDSKDIYHNFRPYAKHMESWVENIKEGESAFNNLDPKRRPHKIVDGKFISNAQKNGDKYTRCYWDKPGACIHTRNDIFASQSTIHPTDNRVFSIRELMKLMTIPDEFKWSDVSADKLNNMTMLQKSEFLKKNEVNIRQSIGEAVPTTIFRQIASNAKNVLKKTSLNETEIKKLISEEKLDKFDSLKKYVEENSRNYSYAQLAKIIELSNSLRDKHAAYYTRQDICYTLIKDLPAASNYKNSIKILEPSVGAGNFLPGIINKYKSVPNVVIDVVDIDIRAIDLLKTLIRKIDIPENIQINYIVGDFLLMGTGGLFEREMDRYDLVIGNPPFGKVDKDEATLHAYKQNTINSKTNNLFAFFLEKSIQNAECVSFILPKSFLSSPEFDITRSFIREKQILKIIDYGEKAFKGVKIETIGIIIRNASVADNNVLIESYINNNIHIKPQSYICSTQYPYWLIYRDNDFDRIAAKLKLNVFKAFRDRQITKEITKPRGKLRILKSRNIANNSVKDIPNYDSYVDSWKNLAVAKFLNKKNVVLVPNLTYNPRACFLPANTLVDGSVAILTPTQDYAISNEELEYYNTDEFTGFYQVARNLGTRSLNIDNNSVFFFGITKKYTLDGQQG